MPLEKICALVNHGGSITITLRRRRRDIRKLGFYSRVAAQKPFLCAPNLLKRTSWALNHWNWNLSECARVLITGE